ncbi:hypothetical protein GGQ84_001669 [Desulfitispora alkaliphila]|uniref:DUF1657 domain-containing protein n=1 Tax=Desulfitispora alkaliphila TaxID=622674 RepID=UPI003D20D8A0
MTSGDKVKQTVSSLKVAHGTLGIYSLQSSEEEAKLCFREAHTVLGQIISKLEGRVAEIELEEPQYKGH